MDSLTSDLTRHFHLLNLTRLFITDRHDRERLITLLRNEFIILQHVRLEEKRLQLKHRAVARTLGWDTDKFKDREQAKVMKRWEADKEELEGMFDELEGNNDGIRLEVLRKRLRGLGLGESEEKKQREKE